MPSHLQEALRSSCFELGFASDRHTGDCHVPVVLKTTSSAREKNMMGS
jgi:hypothetical protein